MHNSPLKCTTNDAAQSSPVKYDGLKSSLSGNDLKSSPVKAAGAAQISPEKKTRENMSSTDY